MPIASTTRDALTDAPALAWRLLLRGNREEPLPWEALRDTAVASLGRSNDPFVELHHLLVLAGARDTAGIDAWLDAHEGDTLSRPSGILVRMGEALGDCARKNYRRAAGKLLEVVPVLPEIGGSRAQLALFTEMQARMAVA